ncbi:MAG: hypothetical protein UIQ51_08060 [Bacteroidales bacterium]|nr:hypothetical protein [Bacteroidales bacterium]
MPYYIQLQGAGLLKLVNCAEITPQEANGAPFQNGQLVVDRDDTAKAITCLLGNIDRNDTPLDLILRLADIITNIQGINITSNTIIQHLNNGTLNPGNNYIINERVGYKDSTITPIHI